MCLHACVHVCVYRCACACACACICVYRCVRACLCMCPRSQSDLYLSPINAFKVMRVIKTSLVAVKDYHISSQG